MPRDHHQPDSQFRRRRVVVAITLLIGGFLLWRSLSVKPGDAAFYPLTAALAATWVIGGLTSGPLHLGRIAFRSELRRPVGTPFAIGLFSAVVFVGGALIVREIGPLRDITDKVLEHARQGSIPLVVALTLANGIAEEIFFRGALYAAIGRRHPVLISTLCYTLATAATGNVMLVFAAALLGAVWALQRRASGGILASSISHVTWSAAMVFVLPPLFAR
ncbi:lysostaphin resistance A-like protein [Jatrophihabitans telluris]|uniref:Lysostaphin resistance A-like protein n=1 Tax=Jatrophihabitans telluris TaxID=2038343 RepID=A0ABY4R0Y9_9ACTN|nr:CPBP family intramembrane glutamic endopeptidase [Jatrophihabitans telluris]UQX88911.1 lysostaphin resistance A-like protein [Jatrophihabitans telluris]